MKIVLLVLSALSLLAKAGLPETDYVVDALRESFKRGFSPNVERTLPNKGLWACGMYSVTNGAQSGTVGIVLGGIKFNQTDKGLESVSLYHKGDVPYFELNNSKATYNILADGSKNFYHFVREAHGGLVIERAVRSSKVLLPSVINPTLTVTQYSYCLPYEKKTNREKVFNYRWDTILQD